MNKRKLPDLTLWEKHAAIVLFNSGDFSYRDIQRKLGISKSTAHRLVQRYQKSKSLQNLKSSRKKRMNKKLVPVVKRFLIDQIERNRKLSSAALSGLLYERFDGLTVAPRTIRQYLVKKGYHGFVCLRKPLLRPANKEKRLQWALNHQDWTVEQWKKVLWSDEKKFELFNSKRRQYCRRKLGEPLRDDTIQATVKKGGGSVMFWACFAGGRVGDLVKINGIMDKNKYHSILKHHCIPSGNNLLQNPWIMQEDNDPKHSSKLCRNYIKSKEDQGLLVKMDWPSQSPDLSPIELLFDEMDRRVARLKPTNLQMLEDVVRQCWNSLDEEVLMKLVSRMPRVCQAVIAAGGGYFNEKLLPEPERERVY